MKLFKAETSLPCDIEGCNNVNAVLIVQTDDGADHAVCPVCVKTMSDMNSDNAEFFAQEPLTGDEDEPTCECGTTIAWIDNFFDDPKSHIRNCPGCRKHTYHVSDESARCVNCKYSSGVDAEGNYYVNGQIVSNGGKSIDQLRGEYFDGYSFMVG